MLCPACHLRPAAPAWYQVGTLPVRRIDYCDGCLTELRLQRQQPLDGPLLRGWPIDFSEVRRHLPAWTARTTTEERLRTQRRLGEVAALYRQRIPSDVEASIGDGRAPSDD